MIKEYRGGIVVVLLAVIILNPILALGAEQINNDITFQILDKKPEARRNAVSRGAPLAATFPIFLRGISIPIAMVSGTTVTLVAGGVALAILAGYGLSYILNYVWATLGIASAAMIVEGEWVVEDVKVSKEYDDPIYKSNCRFLKLNEIINKGYNFNENKQLFPLNCDKVSAYKLDKDHYCYISWKQKWIDNAWRKVLCHIKYQDLPARFKNTLKR